MVPDLLVCPADLLDIGSLVDSLQAARSSREGTAADQQIDDGDNGSRWGIGFTASPDRYCIKREYIKA